MSPLKGQKIKDKPKNKLLQVRVDNETMEKLDYLVSEQGTDKSKVVRKGIEIQYEELKEQEG